MLLSQRVNKFAQKTLRSEHSAVPAPSHAIPCPRSAAENKEGVSK